MAKTPVPSSSKDATIDKQKMTKKDEPTKTTSCSAPAAAKKTPAAATASSSSSHATEWPDAAPLDGEELIFSISCGNSHLHWSTHYGEGEDFNPQIFWRTPHLKVEDTQAEDLVAILSRNLPDDPHDHIFGKAEEATAADAVSQSEKRAAPLISVYVVSTNSSQAALLAKIWATVPSRFFIMKGDDFFKKAEGRYDSMGTDRLATLTGAVHLHGHPALVFDGGTATTYSATDSDGKILGGGIGPGIQSKFRSLTKDTDALPEITPAQVIARVNEAQEKGKPLPTFARNTQEAMMADAFQEFALKGRNVISHWLIQAKSSGKISTLLPPDKENGERRIICTGGDGDLLMQLLQPHYGGVIEHTDTSNGEGNNNRTKNGQYIVESSKHLIHYGIASVLANALCKRKLKEEFKKNPHKEHMGKRVAKMFEVEADDGDNVFRGKVVKVVEVEGPDPEFRIQYDDGDSEDVSSSELFDMIKMFAQHGEKKTKKADAPAKGKNASQKRKSGAQKEKKEKAQKEKAQKVKTATEKESKKKAAQSSEDDKKASAAPDFPMKTDKKSKTHGAVTEAKKPAAKLATKAAAKPATKKKAASAPPSDAKKPAAKKSKTSGGSIDITSQVNSSDPRSFVRKRVAKDFDGALYFGTVMEYDDTGNPAYWHVEYDDGDEEDYSKKDLIKGLKYHLVKGKKDKNAKKR